MPTNYDVVSWMESFEQKNGHKVKTNDILIKYGLYSKFCINIGSLIVTSAPY